MHEERICRKGKPGAYIHSQALIYTARLLSNGADEKTCCHCTVHSHNRKSLLIE